MKLLYFEINSPQLRFIIRLYLNSDFLPIIFQILNKNSLLPFIDKQIAKLKDKIV